MKGIENRSYLAEFVWELFWSWRLPHSLLNPGSKSEKHVSKESDWGQNRWKLSLKIILYLEISSSPSLATISSTVPGPRHLVNQSLDFSIGRQSWELCKSRWSGKGWWETTCQAKERTLPHISQGWHNHVSEKEDIISIAVLESRVWIETPCTKVC